MVFFLSEIIVLYFVPLRPNAGKYGPERRRIRTLFTQVLQDNQVFEVVSGKYPCLICCMQQLYKQRIISRMISGEFCQIFHNIFPAVNYLFKINNVNTRAVCEICSKLTIKTPEQRY